MNGSLFWNFQLSGDPSGTVGFQYDKGTQQVTGTYPALSEVPFDEDFEFLDCNIHIYTDTNSVTVTSLQSGISITGTIDASNSLHVAWPGQQPATIALHTLGVVTVLPACETAMLAALGIGIASGLFAAAALWVGCVNDGPYAAFFCGGAAIIAAAVLHLGYSMIKAMLNKYC